MAMITAFYRVILVLIQVELEDIKSMSDAQLAHAA